MSNKSKYGLGRILYEGPSVLDGTPIVVIATIESKNVKTGDMIQIWIMRQDMKPQLAAELELDYSVCGNCIHAIDNTCYVKLWHGPRAVWETYKRGRYTKFDPNNLEWVRGRKIRWGAYGDPSLVPEHIVRKLNAVADAWTGYTHQWQEVWASWTKDFFQASCDTPNLLYLAQSLGFGTFTVLPLDFNHKDLDIRTTICPASLDESVQCIECGKCDGANNRARQIVIEAHGKGASKITF